MEAITAPALDGWLDDLSRNLSSWQALPLARRLSYIAQLRKDCHRLAARWAEVCCQIKGIDPKSQLAGEEWAMGPLITLRNLRLLEKQLQAPPRQGSRLVRALPEESLRQAARARVRSRGPASSVRGAAPTPISDVISVRRPPTPPNRRRLWWPPTRPRPRPAARRPTPTTLPPATRATPRHRCSRDSRARRTCRRREPPASAALPVHGTRGRPRCCS